MVLYSARQKSWPVIHKLNEKSYEQCQKCLLLVDMHRGHNSTGIWSSPLLNRITSWILVGMLIFLSLSDIGLLNLIWLRVLAFVNARTLLSQGPHKHLQLLSCNGEIPSQTAIYNPFSGKLYFRGVCISGRQLLILQTGQDFWRALYLWVGINLQDVM